MNEDLKSREAVVQNLKDAGCSQDIIKEFLPYFDENEKEKQLEVLERRRNYFLNIVHGEEKKINCLDYLVYKLKIKN